MLQAEYIRKHIDILLSLSHEVNDRAVSAKLRAMADELRIMLSVADISDMAAALNKNAAPLAADLIGTDAVPSHALGVTGTDPKAQPLSLFQARYSGLSFALACSRVGAP